MYPWWPPWLCHYLHGREDGPEHLTPWLLNVSERPFLPSSFYKKRHLGPSSYSSVLGVICQHLYDTAWGSEWVLVVGVIAGSPPSGFSGVDRDIIYLSLRLHQIVFLLEEKYWPTLMVRPSEQVTNRNRLFLCTRFLYQKQILFWKKKKKDSDFWSPIGGAPLWWAVMVLIFLGPLPGFRIPGSASRPRGVQQSTMPWWWLMGLPSMHPKYLLSSHPGQVPIIVNSTSHGTN